MHALKMLHTERVHEYDVESYHRGRQHQYFEVVFDFPGYVFADFVLYRLTTLIIWVLIKKKKSTPVILVKEPFEESF